MPFTSHGLAMIESDMRIDRNIPLPPKGNAQKYPWDEMEVGDSFFVAGVPASGLLYSATTYAQRHGLKWKFTSRHVEGGTRIWRIK